MRPAFARDATLSNSRLGIFGCNRTNDEPAAFPGEEQRPPLRYTRRNLPVDGRRPTPTGVAVVSCETSEHLVDAVGSQAGTPRSAALLAPAPAGNRDQVGGEDLGFQFPRMVVARARQQYLGDHARVEAAEQ